MTIFNVSTAAGFQSALSQAKAGDSIALASGSYSGLTISNVNIAGSVTITSQNLSNPAVISNFSMSNSQGLSFSHLTFSANPATDAYYGFRVSNCQNISYDSLSIQGTVAGSPASNPTGFLFSNCTNVSVTNSVFQNLSNGLMAQYDSHVTVSGNTFTGLDSDGIDSAGSSYVTIANNMFTDFTPVAGDHPDAIQFFTNSTTTAAHDITITGNEYIRGAGSDAQGIFMTDDSGVQSYSNVTITNNVLVGAMYNGLMLASPGSTNVQISNNYVVGFSDFAEKIFLSGATNASLINNVTNTYAIGSNTNLTQSGDQTVAATTATSPPTLLNLTPAAAAFHGTAVTVAPSLLVVDPASATLASATVSVTGGFLAGDALNFTSQNGVTGSYNASTGVLTLTGAASLAAYQAVLDSVSFSSSAADPTSGGKDTARTVSYVINDGAHTSAALTASLTVGASTSSTASPPPPPPPPPPVVSPPPPPVVSPPPPPPPPPVVSPPPPPPVVSPPPPPSHPASTSSSSTSSTASPVLTNSGSAATYSAIGVAANIAHSLKIADVGSAKLASATVVISGGFITGDSLHFAHEAGITGSYNAATGALTFSGSASLATYQAELDSVTFSSLRLDPTNGGADASRSVSFSVSDGHQISNLLTAKVLVTDPYLHHTGHSLFG